MPFAFVQQRQAGQFPEFRQARFHESDALLQYGNECGPRGIDDDPNAARASFACEYRVEVRRNAGRQAAAHDEVTRRRREGLDVRDAPLPFVLCNKWSWQNEAELATGRGLADGEVFASITGNPEADRWHVLSLQQLLQQLAGSSPGKKHRKAVSAKTVDYPGNIDASATRISSRVTTP